MEIITLLQPENVLAAVKNGQKIAVFALDEGEKPQIKLSDLKLKDSLNSDKTEDLLEPALRYLKNNYNKDIKLSNLADLCDISPSYFSRLFSRNMGCCLSDYILNLRLEHACRLLLTTRRTVVSIACEAGYVDCGYFYKLFRKKYGCTPLEYRRFSLIT